MRMSILALMSLMVAVSGLSQETGQQVYYRVTGTKLLVRDMPDQSGKVIASVVMDEHVQLVEMSGRYAKIGDLRAEWFRIKTASGVTGYVFSAYLAVESGFITYGRNDYLQGDLTAEGVIRSGNLAWYPATTLLDGFPAYRIGGSWYLCCRSGIMRYTDGRYRLISLPLAGPRNAELILSRIDYLPEISGFAMVGKDLWVSTCHDGLFIYDTVEERFREIPGHIDNSLYIQQCLSNKYIWEGYYEHVTSYDPGRDGWTDYSRLFTSLGNPSSHYRIYVDDDIWMNGPAHAYCRGGLVRYNCQDGSYAVYRKELPGVKDEPDRFDYMNFMSSPLYVFISYSFIGDRNALYISSYCKKTGEWKAYTGPTLHRVIDLMTGQVPAIRWENVCFINRLEEKLEEYYGPSSVMAYRLTEGEYARLVQSVRDFYTALSTHGIGREMKNYGLYENLVSGNAIYSIPGQWKPCRREMTVDIKNPCPYTDLYGSVRNGIVVAVNHHPALLDPVRNTVRYFTGGDSVNGSYAYIDNDGTRVYLRSPGMDEDDYYVLDTGAMTARQIGQPELPAGCDFKPFEKRVIYRNYSITLRWNGLMVETINR